MTKFSELDEKTRIQITKELGELYHKRTGSAEETLRSLYKIGLIVNAGGITVLLPLIVNLLNSPHGYLLVLSLLAFTVGILLVVIVQLMSTSHMLDMARHIHRVSEILRTDKADLEDRETLFDQANRAVRPMVPNFMHYASFIAWIVGAIFIFSFLTLNVLCST